MDKDKHQAQTFRLGISLSSMSGPSSCNKEETAAINRDWDYTWACSLMHNFHVLSTLLYHLVNTHEKRFSNVLLNF